MQVFPGADLISAIAVGFVLAAAYYLFAGASKGRRGPLSAAPSSPPFSFVHGGNAGRLAAFLARKDPRQAAVVLSALAPEPARAVFGSLPQEMQAQIALESAVMRELRPGELEALDAELRPQVERFFGGAELVEVLLRGADGESRRGIVERLEAERPELGRRLRAAFLPPEKPQEPAPPPTVAAPVPAPAPASAYTPQDYAAAGLELYGRGDYEACLPYFRYALGLDPGLRDARRHLALALYQLGRSPESLEQFEALFEAHPEPALREWVEALREQI